MELYIHIYTDIHTQHTCVCMCLCNVCTWVRESGLNRLSKQRPGTTLLAKRVTERPERSDTTRQDATDRPRRTRSWPSSRGPKFTWIPLVGSQGTSKSSIPHRPVSRLFRDWTVYECLNSGRDGLSPRLKDWTRVLDRLPVGDVRISKDHFSQHRFPRTRPGGHGDPVHPGRGRAPLPVLTLHGRRGPSVCGPVPILCESESSVKGQFPDPSVFGVPRKDIQPHQESSFESERYGPTLSTHNSDFSVGWRGRRVFHFYGLFRDPHWPLSVYFQVKTTAQGLLPRDTWPRHRVRGPRTDRGHVPSSSLRWPTTLPTVTSMWFRDSSQSVSFR